MLTISFSFLNNINIENEKKTIKFLIFRICAEQFQYVGRNKILSDMKTATPDCNGKLKPIKARTLPARMSPPDFSKEPPIIVEKNNTVNRENLVNTSVTTGQFDDYYYYYWS